MRSDKYVVMTYDKVNYNIVRKEYRCNSKAEAIQLFRDNHKFDVVKEYAVSQEYLKAFNMYNPKDKESASKHQMFLMRHAIKRLRIDSEKINDCKLDVAGNSVKLTLNDIQVRILTKILEQIPNNLIGFELV